MKRKKIIGLFVLLVFFGATGIWYVWQRKEEPEQIQSVFLTVTPEPTKALQENLSVETVTDVPETEPKILVFLCGAVTAPGVYEMPKGSRLVDALTLAGGFLAEADTDYHNLARTLSDGERVYILSKEESALLSLKEQVAGESVQGAEAQKDTKEKKINLNTATVAELTSLPGIGESRAESIVEYRSKVGGFRDVTEIMNISGIGEAMFEKIKDRITIE